MTSHGRQTAITGALREPNASQRHFDTLEPEAGRYVPHEKVVVLRSHLHTPPPPKETRVFREPQIA
jgi:hypothetical protein